MVKILFIEDKPTDALLMQSFLKGSKKEKFDLLLASSFSSGLSLLTSKDFNIVLLSLDLKDIRNTHAAILALTAIKNIPVIVCTNSRDENLKLMALNCGAWAYVIKNQIQVTVLIDQIKFVVASFERSSNSYMTIPRHMF